VPPLTISYVEQLRSGKEKLQRKDKENAFFTDDGFVMGRSSFFSFFHLLVMPEAVFFFYLTQVFI